MACARHVVRYYMALKHAAAPERCQAFLRACNLQVGQLKVSAGPLLNTSVRAETLQQHHVRHCKLCCRSRCSAASGRTLVTRDQYEL
jgi:phosphoketolase